MTRNCLKEDVDRYASDLRRSSRLLALAKSGSLSPAMMGKYLAGVSYLVDRTQAHLRLARATAEARGDTRLARYFERKTREEAGHEEWGHSDLRSLETHFGVAIPRDPPGAIVSLVREIEDGIRIDPYFYLVYTFLAEYLTTTLGPEWVTALSDHCGIPGSAMTIQTRHIELDRHHAEEGAQEIEELVSDPAHMGRLRRMLEGGMRRYSEFFDDVAAAA